MRRIVLLLITLFCFSVGAFSQKPPAGAKAVSPTSASGRYEYLDNLISIRPAEGEKVEISFTGVWPNGRRRPRGGTLNTGSFDELVPLKHGVATVRLQFSGGECEIRIRVLGDRLRVTQLGDSNACGFGFNVSAAGIYKRVADRK